MSDPRLVGPPRNRSPPPDKIRVHRPPPEFHPEPPYLPPAAGGGPDVRKRIPSRSLRSMSPPPDLERPRRIMTVDRRGKSIERCDKSMHFDTGRDDHVVHPRGSPTYMQNLKWSQIEGIRSKEALLHREAPPHMEDRQPPPRKYILQGDSNANMKHMGGGGSGLGNSRIVDENNFNGTSSSLSGHPISLQKSVYVNDGLVPDRPFLRKPPEIGPSGRIIRNFPSSSSGNSNIGVRGDEELHYIDNLHRNKGSTRVMYKEGRELLRTRNDSNSMLVLSRSKVYGGPSSAVVDNDFLGPSEDGLLLRSHGFERKQRKYAGPVRPDGYVQAPPSNYARDPEMDLTSYHDEPLSPGRDDDHMYPVYARRERVNPEYLSDDVYRRMPPSAQGDYVSRDSLRPSYSGSGAPRLGYIESSHKNRESVIRNNHSIPGESAIEYLDNKRNLLTSQHDRESLGSGSDHIVFRTKGSREYEIIHPDEDYGFEGDTDILAYKERIRRTQMSDCDPDFCGFDPSPKRRSRAEELGNYDASERKFKRKYVTEEDITRHKTRNILLTSRNTSRRIEELNDRDDQWTSEDPEDMSVSKRLRFGQLQHRKIARPYHATIASRLSAPDDWVSSHDAPVHVQRQAIGSDGLKGRLRPCPTTYHDSDSLERRSYFYKSNNKIWKQNLDSQDGGALTDDGDLLEDSVTPVKTEPPEDSEEFKQLVDSYFFRFAKFINENPARRRYKEQGYAGTLFCIVCGRQSKEFMDTRRLVTHTFMSRKVGIRAKHLGLHKALCVLMGWSSTVTPNGACIYQVLPEPEALSQKEDLVLWPPVVIIHNSSIWNHNFDEQQVVTIEQMETVLIELGFSGGMIKVRRGKPANQSILVVKFLPTFPGMQEAERLHNYYIENKRGRDECQQLYTKIMNRVGDEASRIHADKIELFLYGYMGIAEDLDKLDFETKKRCAVKSKKEIQEIADAPLKTE